MMKIKQYLSGFANAWSNFVKYPLPEIFKNDADGTLLIRPMIPAVGFAIGICAVIPGLIGIFFGKNVLAFLIGAFLSPFIAEYGTVWSGTKTAAGFTVRKMNGESADEILSSATREFSKDYHYALALAFFYTLRCILFGFLTMKLQFAWIVIAYTAAYLFRAELASLPGTNGSLFETESIRQKQHWHVGLGLMLLTGFFGGCVSGACIAAILCWGLKLFSWNFQEQSENHVETTPFLLDFAGGLSELLFLFLGILIYVK